MSSPEGAASKVRILQAPDRRPSKNTRRRKFQNLFRTDPMNDLGTRQCGAKARSGEPCRRSPAPGKASAVSMVVRPAAVRQLASVMGHGRAADTAKRSHPHRDTRPGRITGPRRGRRTPPWQTFPTSARSYRPYGRNREREYRSELRAPRVILLCARCLLFEWGDIGER